MIRWTKVRVSQEVDEILRLYDERDKEGAHIAEDELLWAFIAALGSGLVITPEGIAKELLRLEATERDQWYA